MIRAESLTKFYDSRCVVRDLGFTIEDREIVGFLGLNGAGKTTALRMLAGLLTPSWGKIRIDGKDLLEDPVGMRWRIGFLPEPPPLYDDMSVEGFLAFAARLHGKEPARLPARIDEVLETTAIRHVRKDRIGTLSHGFRQRLGIAQAIVHDPALVILDEPINGLDPVQIVEMRSLIARLKERHTVLLSSHILPEISQTCDRILILRDGELVAEGTEAALAAKMSGGGRAMLLTVAGPRETVEKTLDGADVVSSWSVTAQTDDDGQQIRAVLGREEPEALAAAIVGAGLGLKRFEPVKSELEQLFIELTGAAS